MYIVQLLEGKHVEKCTNSQNSFFVHRNPLITSSQSLLGYFSVTPKADPPHFSYHFLPIRFGNCCLHKQMYL